MSDFSARILDDILNSKNVVMSSKMSLVSDEIDDEEVLDELEEVDELDEKVSEDVVENEEVLDELDDVENNDVDEVDNEEISEDEEVLDELDSVDEVPTSASPSEELKAFSQLEETVDNFIINSDIDFSANPRLKEFAQKFTEELETTIDELRQEKNDSLFEGVISSKKVAVKADKDYKDVEVETAHLIADCLRKCKEISLVDTNNNIIENTGSFVIDLENSNESFNVKVTSRGKVAVSKKVIKADKTIEAAKGPKFFRFWLRNYKHAKDSFKGDVTAFASLNEEEKVTFSGKFSGKFTSEGNAKDVVISLPSIVKTDGKDVAGEKRETLRKEAVKILTDTLDGKYFTDISDLPSKVHILSKKVVESAVYQGEYEVAVTIFDAKGNLKKVRKKFKTEDARAKWIDKQEESGNLYQVDGYLDPEN